MRSRSPPGSMATARIVDSSTRIEQFCWNGVTGTMISFTDPAPQCDSVGRWTHACASSAFIGTIDSAASWVASSTTGGAAPAS